MSGTSSQAFAAGARGRGRRASEFFVIGEDGPAMRIVEGALSRGVDGTPRAGDFESGEAAACGTRSRAASLLIWLHSQHEEATLAFRFQTLQRARASGVALAAAIGLAAVCANAPFALACEGLGCVGQAVGEGVHDTGVALDKGARVTGHAIERGARATGHVVKRGARATGHVVEHGAHAVGEGVQETGKALTGQP